MSELGADILRKIADLRLEGMVDGDEISKTLLASCFADALRKDQTPRSILDDIWQALPSDETWNEWFRDFVDAGADTVDATT